MSEARREWIPDRASNHLTAEGRMADPNPTLEQRFWSKVRKTETCWLWQRQLNNKGYGRFLFYSRSTGRTSRGMYAHRVSWILINGPIPEDVNVLHRCDTPACVNPAHLFLGTQADNMADCSDKGRFCRDGCPPHRRKLTTHDVIAIREDGRTHAQISRAYGISRGYVNNIKQRRIRKRVT
jgi:hypothetical protein